MKKISLLLMSILLIFSTGCNMEKQIKYPDKPQIYTSFYCIYDFANTIGGDKIEVHNLVPTGTEPHDWEPSTRDMAYISEGDILFYNGAGMESWIDKVTASAGEKIKYVELSENIAGDEVSDPHIWLDPLNAVKMAEKIKETLCEIDSLNTDYYNNNFMEFKKQAENVDNEYKSAFNNISDKKIVVAHEAYGWLCKAYGLEQTAIEGLSAEGEPSPIKMQELVETIKQNNIKYIFYEELISPKVAKSLSDESGTQLIELNPFEGLTDEEIAEGKNYISVMKENLENLKKALVY